MHHLVQLLIVIAVGACSAPATAADYLTELDTAARTRHLAEAPEWRALLHYQKDWLGNGYTSEATSPTFFLAQDGRTDPTSELDATIASFFRAPPAGAPDDSTQCLFIARYRWLDAQLKFDRARLPEQACPQFQQWYDAIDPGSAVLVFTSSYLDNPSSMFGHTLLRFDSPAPRSATHLESYAVTFNAATTDTGLTYALAGLTGRYPGSYSIEPYFKIVRNYSDTENRDIWEYALNFTPTEIHRMLEHIWELRDVRFPYYFTARNCSYALLALMDAARPEAALSTHFSFEAIPADTVRVAVTETGLGQAAVFRPSLATRIRTYLARMPPADRKLARELTEGVIAPDSPTITELPAQRAADIYDSAAHFLIYQDYDGERTRQDYAPLMASILAARSQIPPGEEVATPAPGSNPILGHDSRSTDLVVGRLLGGTYQQAGIRLGYHTLADPAPGYPDGTSIDMLALGLRRSLSDGRTRLEYLHLADVVSLVPRDAFRSPLSWEAGLGWDRRWTSTTQRSLTGDIHGGLGPTYSLGENLSLYAFVETTLLTGGGIPKGYAMGYGPQIGVLWHATTAWNVLIRIEAQRFPDHLGFTAIDYNLTQCFAVTRDLAIRITFSRQGVISAPNNNLELALLTYF